MNARMRVCAQWIDYVVDLAFIGCHCPRVFHKQDAFLCLVYGKYQCLVVSSPAGGDTQMR